jgi:hypothetical protein
MPEPVVLYAQGSRDALPSVRYVATGNLSLPAYTPVPMEAAGRRLVRNSHWHSPGGDLTWWRTPETVRRFLGTGQGLVDVSSRSLLCHRGNLVMGNVGWS